jgi:hypothetical protein
VNAASGQRHARTSVVGSAQGWNQRAFVATGAVFSGLALPVTGLLDHAAGGSSAANAVAWSIAHTTLGALFAGFCIWHIALNRRALLRYLRAAVPASGRPGGAAPAREALIAAALVGGVLAATVLHALLEG